MYAGARKGNGRNSGGKSEIAVRIENEVGSGWIFNYYLYVHFYKIEPESIDSFFEGFNCIPLIKEVLGE